MDFLDPKKKRAHQIRLYIGYALMALALAVGSAVLFFEARGFDLDRKTGEIIQNGLVFADTHPESAEIYVNGKREGTTNTRLTIPAGSYTFEFKREGYRTWTRSFNLGGSEIERLNYAFLFPNDLKPTEVKKYAETPSFATQSPDRKWVVVLQPGSLTKFDVFDLSNQDQPPVTTLTLPNSLLTQTDSKHTYKPVEWSNDNRHFVFKHSFTGGSEFLLIDREQPSRSINLNKHFDMTLSNVEMRDKKFDRLLLLDKNGGTLRLGELSPKKLSTVAEKVLSFKSYSDDVVLYVSSQSTEKGKVTVFIKKGNEIFTLRRLPASKQYPLVLTRYDSVWYLAVGSPSEKKAYIYHDFFRDLESKPAKVPFPLSVLKLDSVDYMATSTNSRFISIQGGSEFAVYDVEHERVYQYNINLKLEDQEAKWMDGHRLTAIVNSKLVVWDYDGINKQTLVGAHPGFLPFFDRDYDFLYTLSPSVSKGQTAFNKTPMRTEADL